MRAVRAEAMWHLGAGGTAENWGTRAGDEARELCGWGGGGKTTQGLCSFQLLRCQLI